MSDYQKTGKLCPKLDAYTGGVYAFSTQQFKSAKSWRVHLALAFPGITFAIRKG